MSSSQVASRLGSSATACAKPGFSAAWVASRVDNSMIESFWSTMQRELLDTKHWSSKQDPIRARDH
jgi:hypothetical protein